MTKLKFRLDFSFDRLNWTDCHFKFDSSRLKISFFANLKYLGNLVDSSITRTSSFLKNYNFVTSVNSMMTNLTGPVSISYSLILLQPRVDFYQDLYREYFIIKFSGLKHIFILPRDNNCPTVRGLKTYPAKNITVRIR